MMIMEFISQLIFFQYYSNSNNGHSLETSVFCHLNMTWVLTEIFFLTEWFAWILSMPVWTGFFYHLQKKIPKEKFENSQGSKAVPGVFAIDDVKTWRLSPMTVHWQVWIDPTQLFRFSGSVGWNLILVKIRAWPFCWKVEEGNCTALSLQVWK